MKNSSKAHKYVDHLEYQIQKEVAEMINESIQVTEWEKTLEEVISKKKIKVPLI